MLNRKQIIKTVCFQDWGFLKVFWTKLVVEQNRYIDSAQHRQFIIRCFPLVFSSDVKDKIRKGTRGQTFCFFVNRVDKQHHTSGVSREVDTPKSPAY